MVKCDYNPKKKKSLGFRHKKYPLIWHSPPNLGLMWEDKAKIGRFSNLHQYISKIINIEKQRDRTAQNQVIQSNLNMHTSQCGYNQFSGQGMINVRFS